jgi:chemotaxis protein CheD
MVRMGELAVSTGPDDVLTSIGLGSCIGLALVDVERRVAGLAHVMLPARPERTDDPAIGKFADTAVPALLDAVLAAGARRPRLTTYMVGGAQMFTFGGRGMDVGTRNDQAVRDALVAIGLRVRASETGGTKGRTIRVRAADGTVTVKESGGVETTISPATRAVAPPRPAPAGARPEPRLSAGPSRPDALPARGAPGRPSSASRPTAPARAPRVPLPATRFEGV